MGKVIKFLDVKVWGQELAEAQGFYSAAEASRIARVPLWTLSAWRREGIIVPSVEWVDEQDKAHLGYTFESLVFLRLTRMLREQRITLLNAVQAVRSLRDRFGPVGSNWAEARIFTHKGEVFVHKRDEWLTTVAPSHQRIFEQIFGNEFARLRERADALLIPQEFVRFVEIDPSIRNGLPIVRNTTVPTCIIHDLRRQDYKYDQIQAMYPFIERKMIIGANRYEEFLDSPVSKVA